MAFWKNNKNPSGQFLLEILISIGVFVLFAGSFALFAVDASRFTTENAQHIQAYWKAQESQSIIAALWKDDGASTFTNGTHGIKLNTTTGSLELSPTPDISDGLERTITIADARRNTNGVLADIGTADPNTKKISLTIATADTNKQLYSGTFYYPTLTPSAPPGLGTHWLETTTVDFQNGKFTNTQVTSTDDGEVTLNNGVLTGTYLSSPFNSGSSTTAYTQLYWTGDYTHPSDIHIQIRVAKNTGRLQKASWFGPDGTATTYFAESDTITLPVGVTDHTYIQYRVQFTQSGSTIPTLNDIDIVYE